MKEKTITLLRVPLLHNCEFYVGEHPCILFTISETTFRKILNELSNKLNEKERKWVINELTKFDLDELQTKSELSAMRHVFEKVKEKDIIEKDILYPEELDVLYEKYLTTKPFVIDEQGKSWKVQKDNKVLTKEELMWVIYYWDDPLL